MTAFYYTDSVSCIFIMLTHWNTSTWLDMLLHSDTLFWFRVNQTLVLLFNAAEGETENTYSSLFLPTQSSKQQSTTLEEDTLTISSSMRWWC